MVQYRIAEAAELLAVSDDTMRRLAASEGIASRDQAGRQVIDGVDLARIAVRRAPEVPDIAEVASSARNRLVGLVTEVKTDTVMAQVEMQCGPHRIVSLISSEALAELGLRPGDAAVAVIKSTMVTIETPGPATSRRGVGSGTDSLPT